MKILVACERSGMVRDAFAALGHDAWSCDTEEARSPGQHYQGDVRDILYERCWDMLIAHPVCRYMCNSGVKHLYLDGRKENGPDPERWANMGAAVEFFLMFERAKHIPLRAVENPIMHGHALRRIGRRASQFVQPWWFGDPFSKATGLWLTGLPKLKRTHNKSDYAEIRQDVWKMGPSADREEKRSETYPAIARAFADQWGRMSEPFALAAE
jgi:hypothetical protein